LPASALKNRKSFVSGMFPILSCQSISRSFGAQELFSGISIAFHENERMGLIGPNGSGKSTLLRILAGLDRPDSGEVTRKNDIRLAYIPQQEGLPSGESVESTLLAALSGEPVEEMERYNRVRRWIGRAGFTDAGQAVDTLSGGWRKRLSIVSALIREPDLLLLDEPTNHLDLEGIIWLEELLLDPLFAFILVTHDRYFLETVSRRVVELNQRYPDGYLKVEGSYSDFIYHREAFLDSQIQLETVLANKVRRESEWLQRGPKARTSKARFRIEEAYCLKDRLSEVRHRNRQVQPVDIDFTATHRKTKKLLVATGIGKVVGGRRLFSGLDLTLTPGSCLGVLGRNGSGKTTLVHVLAGLNQPDSGSIRRAEGAQTVLFQQDRSGLDLAQTLHQALCPAGDAVLFQGRSIHVASWARRFLFRADQLEMPVGQLSGGEQARIFIARMMLKPADILFLDEPTNDLDIPSLEVLEENLADFPGAVVLVTHDRFLLDRLATSVIGLDGMGNAVCYADCGQWLAARKPEKTGKAPSAVTTRTRQPKKKFSYLEQKEWDEIEEKILAAESRLEACQQELMHPETANHPQRLREGSIRLQEYQEAVEGLYRRWEELEEIRRGFAT